jgi:hypothetical protein
MKYVLFVMFLVSPPAKSEVQVWTLQSTVSMEFASQPLCKKIYDEIESAVATTNTIKTRGWCFPAAGEVPNGDKSMSFTPESVLPRNFQGFRLKPR